MASRLALVKPLLLLFAAGILGYAVGWMLIH
jgi:hypothetical protein